MIVHAVVDDALSRAPDEAPSNRVLREGRGRTEA